MPSERAARVSQRRGARNRSVRRSLRTARTAAERGLAAKSPEAQEAVTAALRSMDRAASKGVIHKNKAARLKSRLTRRSAAALDAAPADEG